MANENSSSQYELAEIRAQAYAFQQLVKHMQARTDVQNIDQMNLAGFCRNCLSKWIFAGRLRFKGAADYNQCLHTIYGMEYNQWKKKFQAKATDEQMKLYKSTATLHASHPPEVEQAAKAAKKKKPKDGGRGGGGEKKNKPNSTTTSSQARTAATVSSASAAAAASSSSSSRPAAHPGNNLSDVCCRSTDDVAASVAAAAATTTTTGGASTMNQILGECVGMTRHPARIPSDFKIRVAVLTVSDRASEGTYEDQSGPAVESGVIKYASESGNAVHVIAKKIVPDDESSISEAIRAWADMKDDDAPTMILTTGGTGFAKRDVTPEATKKVLDKMATALAACITLEATRFEPFSLLSRAVAGSRKRTLVFNLPGRPKAVKENLAIAMPKLAQAAYHVSKGV